MKLPNHNVVCGIIFFMLTEFAALFAAFTYNFLFFITVKLATRQEQEVCNELSWSANFMILWWLNTVIVVNSVIARDLLIPPTITPHTTETLILSLQLLPPIFYHCNNYLPTPVSVYTQHQSLLVVKRDSKNYSKLCQVWGQ